MARSIATTERGFGVYAVLKDTYGETVRVQSSSAATRDCVWLFIDNPQKTEVAGAHLDIAQAHAIAKALLDWAADRLERNANGGGIQ